MTPEIAQEVEQQRRQQYADQQAEEWAFDALSLEEMVRAWGIKPILQELSKIYQRLTPDGSKLHWSLPSSHIKPTESIPFDDEF